MALSTKDKWIRNGIYAWLVYLSVIPFCDITFKGSLFRYDFSEGSEFAWLLLRVGIAGGFTLLPFIGKIQNATLRDAIIKVLWIDGVYEIFDAVVLKNLFDPYGVVLQNAIVIYSIHQLYKKRSKLTTHAKGAH